MENLDGTVIATALPSMARSFGVPVVSMGVGITAYLITLATLIPLSGWIADRFGARRVFATAIGVFTLASLFCAISPTLPVFVASRILQGAAGALMVPVGRLVVLKGAPKDELVRAVATITWPGLIAPVLGPPVGGFLTTHATWHWIFLLNLPLGLVGFVLAWKLIPNAKAETPRRFDLIGFIWVGLACVFVMLGVGRFEGAKIAWGEVISWLLAGAVATVLAVRYLRRAEHPLLRLSVFRIETFRVTMVGGSLFRMAIGATPFLLPLMFQEAFHLDAYRSGLLVLIVFAGNLSMKTITTAVLKRFGFRRTILFNGVAAAIGLSAIALIDAKSPLWLVGPILFAGGMARSMQFSAINSLGFADVPPEMMSDAGTLASTIMQLSFSFGIAFGALALQIGSMVNGVPGRLATPDFQIAFVLVGLLALLSLFDAVRLPKDAGIAVSKGR